MSLSVVEKSIAYGTTGVNFIIPCLLWGATPLVFIAAITVVGVIWGREAFLLAVLASFFGGFIYVICAIFYSGACDMWERREQLSGSREANHELVAFIERITDATGPYQDLNGHPIVRDAYAALTAARGKP